VYGNDDKKVNAGLEKALTPLLFFMVITVFDVGFIHQSPDQGGIS
jgi:hypothetical protein